MSKWERLEKAKASAGVDQNIDSASWEGLPLSKRRCPGCGDVGGVRRLARGGYHCNFCQWDIVEDFNAFDNPFERLCEKCAEAVGTLREDDDVFRVLCPACSKMVSAAGVRRVKDPGKTDAEWLAEGVKRGHLCPECSQAMLHYIEPVEKPLSFIDPRGFGKCPSCGAEFQTFKELFKANALASNWGEFAWQTWLNAHPDYNVIGTVGSAKDKPSGAVICHSCGHAMGWTDESRTRLICTNEECGSSMKVMDKPHPPHMGYRPRPMNPICPVCQEPIKGVPRVCGDCEAIIHPACIWTHMKVQGCDTNKGYRDGLIDPDLLGGNVTKDPGGWPTNTLNVYEKFYTDIEALTGDLRSFMREMKHIKLKAPGFMDLVIEAVGNDSISMAHYFVQEGDLMSDPEMEIEVLTAQKTAEPTTYRQDSLGINQTVYHYDEDGKKTKVDPKLKTDLRVFLQQWLKNIRMQGFGRPDSIRKFDHQEIPKAALDKLESEAVVNLKGHLRWHDEQEPPDDASGAGIVFANHQTHGAVQIRRVGERYSVYPLKEVQVHRSGWTKWTFEKHAMETWSYKPYEEKDVLASPEPLLDYVKRWAHHKVRIVV